MTISTGEKREERVVLALPSYDVEGRSGLDSRRLKNVTCTAGVLQV
jgi:hypothetical protein